MIGVVTILLLAIGGIPAMAKKDPKIMYMKLSLPNTPVATISQQYRDLDYGLRIQVRNEVRDNDVVNLSELPTKEAKAFPDFEIETPITPSVEQYLDRTASELGFKVADDFNTDYILNVTIKELSVRVRSYDIKGKNYRYAATMMVSWELLDSDHKTVIGSTISTGHAKSNTQTGAVEALTSAYVQALNGIDWNRIAPKLHIAKSAHQEKNKQVSGKGDTALESTVIRWYIISSPQGADVMWRVVSSTPDVKNTNANYVGTTPYESTESFDIQGLTYNNSGNVQIEVTCERPGYIPQKKRFNLRQVIDQKEISAKFNLVKEEE